MIKQKCYSNRFVENIENIYEHEEDLATDFLFYYFLFKDDAIREETVKEGQTTTTESSAKVGGGHN